MRKARCLNPNREIPKSLKEIVKDPLLHNRCEIHGSLEMTIIDVSQKVWHAKEPPLLHANE